jgi:hypothetical protein
MASNGAATMRVKLGLRHSNSLKSAARAALFIGLFGPTCAQQDYILCFYVQSKFRLSFVVIQRRIREAHGNREKSPLLCWREGEGQALGWLGHVRHLEERPRPVVGWATSGNRVGFDPNG